MSKDYKFYIPNAVISGFISGMQNRTIYLLGAAQTILLQPLDMIKTSFQVYTGKFKSKTILSTFKDVVKQEGFFRLWKGLTPALIGNAVSWGLYFYFYNKGKSLLLQYKHKYYEIYYGFRNKLSTLEHLITAYCVGSVCLLFTNPIWLIKTRMEIQS